MDGVGNAVADWIGMDVAAEVEQVLFVGNFCGVVGASKEGATVASRVAQGVAVDVEDTLWEETGGASAVLAKESVVVVGHQAVGND